MFSQSRLCQSVLRGVWLLIFWATCQCVFAGQIYFDLHEELVFNGQINQIIPSDLDGDGDQDLAIVGSAIWWLEQTGTPGGEYNIHEVAGSQVAEDVPGYRISIGDIDKNGLPDLIGPGKLWLNSNTAARFAPPIELPTSSVTLADIDGDQRLDIVGINDLRLVWYRNLANPLRFEMQTVTTDQVVNLWKFTTGDLDQDGDADILTREGNSLVVYENNPSASARFSRRVVGTMHGLFLGAGFEVVDLDKDNDHDIVIGLSWFENTGQNSGTFVWRRISEDLNHSLGIADLDGDGDLDIIETAGQSIFWFENIGGTPAAFSKHPVHTYGGFGCVFDWDLDGRRDILAHHENKLSVLRNGEPPKIISPANGAVLTTHGVRLRAAEAPNIGQQLVSIEWQVATDEQFAQVVASATSAYPELMSYLVPDGKLSYPKKYYWRMRYHFAGGFISPWSNAASFQTPTLPAARIIRVPQDVPTIGGALIQAGHGGEVIVSPGTYNETLVFAGNDINLHSTNPTDAAVVAATVIDTKTSASAAITFSGAEGPSCRVAGFTIKTATGQNRPAIDGKECKATLEHNVIRGNAAGIRNANGIIRQNLISENGQGLDNCHGTIILNTIEKGTNWEAVVNCHGTIERNIVRDNYGVGLLRCSGLIRNNLIAYNVGNSPPGHIVWSGAGLTDCNGRILNNTIVFNGQARPGGIKFFPDKIKRGGGLLSCRGIIKNNIIWGNRANEFNQIHDCVPVEYCVVEPQAEGFAIGAGVILGDPKLTGDEFFQLQANSPAIDAGGATAYVKNDFFGKSRGMKVLPGFRGDGSGFDIGAHEFFAGANVGVRLTSAGPTYAPADPLEVEWRTNVSIAGSAVTLELLKNGVVVHRFGNRTNATGQEKLTLAIPAGFSGLNFRIRATSTSSTQYVGESQLFFINSSRNAVDAVAWPAYD